MHKIFIALAVSMFLAIGVGCTPTPAELAQESKELHKKLDAAKTAQDSTLIFKQITELESRARQVLDKKELKEYERLAH